jgi:branched-chain amino acid transport system ATP-binding protein
MSGAERPILELRNVSTHYGLISVLRDVSLEIYPGEIACLLGGNASGKSTTLRTILGMVRPSQGEVLYDGEPIGGLPTREIVRRGLSMVPENRRLFTRMTVRENLELGSYLRRDRAKVKEDLERVLELFPRLRERLAQKAGTLSGGEQQMVAMGRALMADPRVLLMDEPSMGLAPILVERSFEIIKQVHEAGIAVLVVEQNANVALETSGRAYVLEVGRVAIEGSSDELRRHEGVRKSYLGY